MEWGETPREQVTVKLIAGIAGYDEISQIHVRMESVLLPR